MRGIFTEAIEAVVVLRAWCCLDRYPDAQRLAQTVLAADPLREATWRSLMRIRSAIGDYDSVITTFAQCQKPLEGLRYNSTPSSSDSCRCWSVLCS